MRGFCVSLLCLNFENGNNMHDEKINENSFEKKRKAYTKPRNEHKFYFIFSIQNDSLRYEIKREVITIKRQNSRNEFVIYGQK